MKNRELKDTIKGMSSTDYKERFKAEYYQVKIRLEKLKKLINKLNNKQLDFNPKCDVGHLLVQLFYMRGYEMILRERADIEGIELDVKGDSKDE